MLSNKDLLDLFATYYGPEVLDVSNLNQIFISEPEFLIGSILGKITPELSMLFPTLQDIFKIKESGSKFKTKIHKSAFIQTCVEQLNNLSYDSKQLQKVREFLK